MGAERPRAVAQASHDLGDRDHRRVAGKDGLRSHVPFDLAKQLLLQRQIFEHGLDNIVGFAHRIGQVGSRTHALDGRLIVAEVPQIATDAVLGAVEVRRNRIVDRHVVAGEREYLGDAVAHQTRPDDGDTRHGSPGRVAAVGVENMTGIEIRRFGREEQQRPGKIGGLPEPAFGHPRQETLAHLP